MSHQNIPAELRELPQWVIADMSLGADGKPKKHPLNPRTGAMASVTDPSTWGTFQDAISSGSKYIGFVLSENDPYCIIDLDDKESKPATEAQKAIHQRIMSALPTYTELSVSGRGWHLIVRGSVPSGVNRDNVEIYSSGRYMICTGNVVKAMPIVEAQQFITNMYAGMRAVGNQSEVVLEDEEGVMEDADLVDMAMNAVNGDKYIKLCSGDWEDDYKSQSEADLALMSMLCFYTRDNEQVRRLFRMTVLGQRLKATRNDKYLNYNLERIRKNEPAAVDFSALRNPLDIAPEDINAAYPTGLSSDDHKDLLAPRPQELLGPVADEGVPPPPASNVPAPPCAPAPVGVPACAPAPPVLVPFPPNAGHTGAGAAGSATGTGDNGANEARGGGGSSTQAGAGVSRPHSSFPPGLVGEMASYVYASAVRPVPEIALVTSIAFLAGIVGRAYNISNTGLNQYLILLAETGSGKEGIGTAMDMMLAAARDKVPAADQFIGPAAFGSGQGLVRTLDSRNCFVSVLGEFGLTLKALCSPKASSIEIMLKKVMLDLYTKSGWNRVLNSTAYSDQEKNTKTVRAPNLTVLGESVPANFFGAIDLHHIAEGLIPRFIVVEYTGKRVSRNRNANRAPSEGLVGRVQGVMLAALASGANSTCTPVSIEEGALGVLDGFDDLCDDQINAKTSAVGVHLYNRAHLQALKLSGLVAVGCDAINPVVTEEIARWSVAYVMQSVRLMIGRFDENEVGEGEHRQEGDIRRLVLDYIAMGRAERKRNGAPEKIVDQKLIIPFNYLRKRMRMLSSFKTDPKGLSRAIDLALADVIAASILEEVPPRNVRATWGLSSRVFVTGPSW